MYIYYTILYTYHISFLIHTYLFFYMFVFLFLFFKSTFIYPDLSIYTHNYTGHHDYIGTSRKKMTISGARVVAVVSPGSAERRQGRHGPGETYRPGLRTGHGGALGGS